MDEGGKTTDQELFEALILIRSYFDYLCSSRGLIIVARLGGNPGPKKGTPGRPRFVSGVRENGGLLRSGG
jgi:hypothetical protein